MNVQGVYIITCDACEREVRQEYVVHQLECLASVTIPVGWFQVDDLLFCAQHKVELVVDGVVAGEFFPTNTEDFA